MREDLWTVLHLAENVDHYSLQVVEANNKLAFLDLTGRPKLFKRLKDFLRAALVDVLALQHRGLHLVELPHPVDG